MNVSAKTRYACLAILELASQYGVKRPVRIHEIGRRHDVPPRFLVQILLQLKGGGLVASTRGAAGGYQLIKPPDEVTLGQVIEVIDGPAEPDADANEAGPVSPAARVLMQTWQEIAAAERKMLHGISLADLLQRVHEHDEQMYYI